MKTSTDTQTSTWKVDPSHSEIGFKVKHLMITNVRGKFDEFAIEVTASDENFENAEIHFTAQAASVNTNSEQRDTHLKSADFFDAENHPVLEFRASGMEKKGDDEYDLQGELTIRGITKPITLEVELGGVVKDPYGQLKAGFTIDGKLNRKDFGLTWNAPTEAGGLLVSDEVKIHCEIQMIKEE